MQSRTAIRLTALCLVLFATALAASGQTNTYQTNDIYYHGRQALPDLVVSKILVPDELPLYTALQVIDAEITNIGKGWMKGNLRIDFEVESRDLSSCKVRMSVGGGFGNPVASKTSRSLRYSVIAPNQTIIVHSEVPNLKIGLPDICRKPLREDFKIRVTINPIQGKGNNPRGAILETNHDNNVLEKEIKVVKNLHRGKAVLDFVRGDNFFSIPVIEETSANAFMQLTQCDLLEVPIQSHYGTRRTIDLTMQKYVPYSDMLVPGKVYLAECPHRVQFTFEGEDPGPFNIALGGRSITPVPTRLGQSGLRMYETLEGCSIARGSGHGTEFFTYVPGSRNLRGKSFPEKVTGTSPITPGLVYLVKCDSSYGGTYDAKDATRTTEERLLEENAAPTRKVALTTTSRTPLRGFGARLSGYNYRYKRGYEYIGQR